MKNKKEIEKAVSESGRNEPDFVSCFICGKRYLRSVFQGWCDIISHEWKTPTCSKECHDKLVEQRKEQEE